MRIAERLFRDLTENPLRRGVFRSVLQLFGTLDEYVDLHNESPRAFIRTAKTIDTLAKVMPAKALAITDHSAWNLTLAKPPRHLR